MKSILRHPATALAAISATLVVVSLIHSGGPDIPSAEPFRKRNVPFRMSLASYSIADPAEELRSISLLPEAERLPSQIRLAHEWGRRDFDAARRWVMDQDAAPRRDLIDALGRAGIGTRPHEVMALADGLADESARLSFFTTMIQAWSGEDPAAASRWAAQCESAAKGPIQTALATAVAQKNAADAARYVALEMEPGPAQDQAALTVAARWAYLDPAAAIRWAASLPESDLRQRLLAAVASLSEN